MEEIKWMREVRDLGLLKMVERMKKERDIEKIVRAVNGFLKEKQIKQFEKDLMVPNSTNLELGDKGASAPKTSIEQLLSRESAVGGGLRINESDIAMPQQKIKKLSADEIGLEGEIANWKRQSWDTKDEKSEECDWGVVGGIGATRTSDSDVRDCQVGSDVSSGWIADLFDSTTPCSLHIEKLSDLPSLEKREEIERERIRKAEENGKSEMSLGGVAEKEKCGKRGGDNESELRGLDEGFNKEYKDDKKVEVRYVDSEGDFMDQREAFRYLSSQLEGLGCVKKREKEKRKDIERSIEILGEGPGVMGCKHGCERIKREEWWEKEREGDKKEIQRLGGVVEELRELVLRGMEKGKEKEGGEVCGGEKKMSEEEKHERGDKDEIHDCDKPGCWCQPSGSGSGSGKKDGRYARRKTERAASNVANMRARDVYGDRDQDEDGDWSFEERGVGNGNGNGKGFWDWVGGGILWRQD
ncbi:uncharacterized protein EAF01_008552 [Botrytis porri]|uniref:uncharacterized protein n=1 Tax=Botrytis porri TaxID=87229 RepID=UPI0019014CEC|nr:uncharacterized protein EAF01_008552 [Botrytis porri]KAF7899339.1 hypothetical protein EAF01_008552 [Botrytis porri]